MVRYTARKIFHIIAGILLIGLTLYLNIAFGTTVTRYFLFFLLAGSLICDFVMIDLKIKLPIFSFLEKDIEKERLHSNTYMLMGFILALFFFDFDIAITAFAMVTFSDPVAALVGRRFGRIKIFKKKTLRGTGSGLIVSLVVGFLLLDGVILIISMAITAALVELLVEKIDDNLAVPLLAGGAGHILRYFFL